MNFYRKVSFFKRYDHLNYAKWGAVYLAEMKQLPDAVLSEFQKGNFVVKRSDRTFNQVDPDQAMEWINGTGKKGGGIVGITKTSSALCRWTLSYNLRSHIAAETHSMFNLCLGSTLLSNEGTKSRRKRDQSDESALLSTLTRFNVFSPASHQESLQNIATKDLATAAIQDSLLRTKELGEEEINEFVRQRLVVVKSGDKPEVPFHAAMHRNNAATFGTLYAVVKCSKDKEKKTVLKADRSVLRRLITAYEAGRRVDLSSVLMHELLPVPLSLAEMNGTLRSGNKSVLADIITQGINCTESIELRETSCIIIDGQALVVTVGKPDSAATFGDLADVYTGAVLKLGAGYQRIDVVFDRYRDETIKGATRTRRSKSARPIRRPIESRDVPLPINWNNFISLAENKADLANFLSEHLSSQAPHDKEIVVAGGFTDESEVSSSNKFTDLEMLRHA